MAKSKVTQKKVTLSELNNHNVSNKRQALKDLKMLNFDEIQFKNPAQRRFYPQDQATDFIGFRCAMSRLGPKSSSKRKTRN